MEYDKLTYAKRYDSSWKDVIESLFQHFFAYFFPSPYDDINWNVKPEFLDTELRSLGLESDTGELHVDKLIRVQLKSGEQKSVFIHLEVQDRKAKNFPIRILNYWCRLRLHYPEDTLSMALLTDSDPTWQPDSCWITGLGFQGGVQFPISKLSECDTSPAALESCENPFTLVAYAHKLAKETTNDLQRRYQERRQLHLLAAQKGWDPKIVIALSRFWDWVLYLPPKLNKAFVNELHQLEKEGIVHISPLFEETWKEGLEEGREEGREEGLKEGHKKGREEGEALGALRSLQDMLKEGFISKEVYNKRATPLEQALAKFPKLPKTTH